MVQIMVDNRVVLGKRFENWCEQLLDSNGYDVKRNVVYLIKRKKRSGRSETIDSVQIDMQFQKRNIFFSKTLYLMEMKYSRCWEISEDAINQVYRAAKKLEKHLRHKVKPYAVVTNNTFTGDAKRLAGRYDINLYDIYTISRMHEKQFSLYNLGSMLFHKGLDDRIEAIEKEISRTKVRSRDTQYISIYV
jgi:hypothetical protein